MFLQMHRAGGRSSRRRQWGFVGESYTRLPPGSPAPCSALSFVRGQCRCEAGEGWGEQHVKLETSENVLRDRRFRASMAPWKALCDGPIPRGRGLRPRDEGPISTQQECTEVPAGARHCAQPGEGRRTVVSGLQLTSVAGSEPLALHCTDPTAGFFAAIVPACRPLSLPVRGAADADSHRGPNGLTFALCSGPSVP